MPRWQLELAPPSYLLKKFRDVDLIVADPSTRWWRSSEGIEEAYEALKPEGWLLFVGRARDLCAFRRNLPEGVGNRAVELMVPLVRYDLVPVSPFLQRGHLIAELFPHPRARESYFQPDTPTAHGLLPKGEKLTTAVLRNQLPDVITAAWEVLYGGAIPTTALAWIVEVFTPPEGLVLEPELGPLSFAPAAVMVGRYYVGATEDEERLEERRIWMQEIGPNPDEDLN